MVSLLNNDPMEIDISKLTWSTSIYPRGRKNEQTIGAYVEALALGAQFPPIKVQRVSNYPDGDGDRTIEAILILDGIHRWFAFEEKGVKKIEAVEWKKEALDYEKNKIALLLESARCNVSHGDRLDAKDKKRIARDIASSDPDRKWTESALAEKLGVAQQTVNAWISDIRARQKAGRDTTILRLVRLGWTQEMIAEKIGLERSVISKIVQNTRFSNLHNLLSQGHDMEYIAGHYNMDLPLAWALHLEGKTDQEKFKALGWGLRTWDRWDFNQCDERFGDDWPGRIPAQLVAHTLLYFTKPGDFVLDPMAGGGVVADVCLVFERKCRSFDLATRDDRPEIEPHYWTAEGEDWPAHHRTRLSEKGRDKRKTCSGKAGRPIAQKPDLIFFDPPYFDKKADEYDDKSISNFTKKAYLEFLEKFFTLAHKHTKKSSRLAFLNADWRDFQNKPARDETPDESILIDDYLNLLRKTGWNRTHIIQCPLSSQRFQASIVSAMQKKGILGTTNRYLIITRRD